MNGPANNNSYVFAAAIVECILAGPYTAIDASLLWALLLVAPIAFLHARTWATDKLGAPPPLPLEKAAYAGVMAYFTVTAYAQSQAFLYFQF